VADELDSFRIDLRAALIKTCPQIRIPAGIRFHCLTPYDKYAGHTEAQITGRIFHAKSKADATCRRLLVSGDVKSYEVEWNGEEWTKLHGELPLDGRPKSVMDIARSILPKDDSSLQWSEANGGITEDPAATLEQLYTRMVEKYEQRTQLPSRTDDDVWRYYRKALETKQVLARLQPKWIIAKDDEYQFDHAWKNGTWNLYEPVSMDLQDADSIRDKANRWLGRATNLKESDDKFRLFVLLGEPRNDKLRPTYIKALNILRKMPVDKEFVTEQEAAKFSQELAQEMAEHPAP
jgi:hypothetical protein